MYEFATLYTDVLKGAFQLYTLQWTGGYAADPEPWRARIRAAAQFIGAPYFGAPYFGTP